jgi:hypothetical protein
MNIWLILYCVCGIAFFCVFAPIIIMGKIREGKIITPTVRLKIILQVLVAAIIWLPYMVITFFIWIIFPDKKWGDK